MEIVYQFLLRNILLIGGMILIGISCGITGHFIWLKTDFTITSVELICEQPLNNRCVSHYLGVTKEGLVIDFVPLAFEFYEGELLAGSHVEKKRFLITYTINSNLKHWQYWPGQLIRFIGGMVCIFLWFRVRSNNK
ncbi:MAG: hypothetical protein WC156_09805 [Pedobacter sp.]